MACAVVGIVHIIIHYSYHVAAVTVIWTHYTHKASQKIGSPRHCIITLSLYSEEEANQQKRKREESKNSLKINKI